MDYKYAIAVLVITALITMLTRAIPFLLFAKRELPAPIVYLGSVLPASIMAILVIYCLRNTNFTAFPFGVPELASALLTAVLQFWQKNVFLSILLGTACYMVLLRVLPL